MLNDCFLMVELDDDVPSWRCFFNDEQLAPAYEGVELGIGDAVLMKAIQGATGRSAKDVNTYIHTSDPYEVPYYEWYTVTAVYTGFRCYWPGAAIENV